MYQQHSIYAAPSTGQPGQRLLGQQRSDRNLTYDGSSVFVQHRILSNLDLRGLPHSINS